MSFVKRSNTRAMVPAVWGDKARAIENYERSVQLNPKNAGGIEALRTLRGG